MDNINKILLWATKITAAIFNAPSTGYVFYAILSRTDRSPIVVYFNTLLAVLLIDLFFLWVLTVLEDSSIDPIKRMPMALSSVLLSVAIIVIGFEDEGLLSYAPRVGLLALVFNDLVSWGTDYWSHYNSREQIEKRIRNREVIFKRKANEKAQKKVIKELAPSFEEKWRQRILDQLNVENSERSELTPVQDEELPKNVEVLDDGTIAWRTPKGELITETSTGGVYKNIRGAQIAAARAWSKNGH